MGHDHKCSCQQFALYAAEASLPKGRSFSGQAELQAYVDSMRDTPLWERQYEDLLRVEAFAKGSTRDNFSCGAFDKSANCGVVEMLPVHMNELYVCHEVAHVLADFRYGSHAHDPWFARTYLELVYTMMGAEAYAALRDAFENGGIDHQHDSSIPAGRTL